MLVKIVKLVWYFFSFPRKLFSKKRKKNNSREHRPRGCCRYMNFKLDLNKYYNYLLIRELCPLCEPYFLY